MMIKLLEKEDRFDYLFKIFYNSNKVFIFRFIRETINCI